MLKIKEIKYELENKGPANGHPEISVYFDEVEDTENKIDLFTEFKDILATLPVDINDAYERGLDGSQETMFKMNDSAIIKNENFEQFQDFLNDISRESLDLQKELDKQGKLKLKDYRPPYFLWEGKPEIISDKDAYELFNNVYTVITNEDQINQLALVQIMNHTMGHIYVDWVGNGKDAEFIDNMRTTFRFFRVIVISKPEFRKEAVEFCLKNGYVNYTYMED